ncbi:S-layer homology domain-containing protein, partial [Paenibacillus sp. FJAT-27812]|uniref:S-layer homology domain-containing protein n=1 Tax=Paenibacillus sp. FJAT-27812 TaxID=1684143 RepID=UPI0018D0824D
LFEDSWVELVLKTPADDLYGKNEILHLTVNYGYEVTVTGTPRIPLVIGTGSATEVVYASYSGAQGVALTELSFAYEIPEGLEDEDGIAINPRLDLQGGASIRRASGSAASVAFAEQNTSGLRIVSIPPVVALVAGANNGSAAEVTVNATVKGTSAGNTLAKLAWLSGSHNIADYAGGAGTDILAAQKFSVTANGIYTVYARDAAGNESVKEIVITGIGAISPGPGGNGSGNPDTAPANTASIMLGGVRTEVRMTTEIAADGQPVKRLHLTPEQVAKSAAAGQADLLITVEGLGSAVKVSLPAASILMLRETHPNAIARINVNGNSLQIPLSGAKEIKGEGIVTATIAQASDTSGNAIKQAIAKQGAVSLLEHPIMITLDVDGKPINAQRTITLPAAVAQGIATAVWMDANNKLHFAPSLIASNGTVTIQSPHDGVYAVIQLNRTFADLQGHWAQGDIELLASKLIVDGQPDGSFAPNHTITRAEFAALLVRALGLQEANAGEFFTDVKESSWYAGAVGAAEQAGLIGGFEDGSFRPNASITREQMAVMIARALSFAGKAQQAESAGALQLFADGADISDWAIVATEQLVEMEIIQGLTDTTFVPKANASRAQSAVILKRMLQYLQYINL